MRPGSLQAIRQEPSGERPPLNQHRTISKLPAGVVHTMWRESQPLAPMVP